MSPVIGGILPREVLPGGIDIDGHHFPPGVDVGVPIYAIQHHDAYYPQPWKFIPERWVVNENLDRHPVSSDANADPIRQIGTPESMALAKSVFCPFGLGPRACVGKSLAYKEITIVIARLVWLYEMRLSPGRFEGEGNPKAGVQSGRHRVKEYQGQDMFVLKANGPVVEFKLRGRGNESGTNK
jgi:cytochrome P450